MTVRISDHAVLRYLERAHGLDIEAVRDHLSGLTASAAALGAIAVKVEGVKIVLVDKCVPTVLDRRTVMKWPLREKDPA